MWVGVRQAVAALILIITASCVSQSDPPPTESEAVRREVIPSGPKIDILFVVDNSSSMCEEQFALRDFLVDLVDDLVQQRSEIQVAVITTNMETPEQSGRLQNIPHPGQGDTCPGPRTTSDCPSPENGGEYPPLTIRTVDERYQDEQGQPDAQTIRRDLGCSLTVGTSGSPRSMGLEAARTALGDSLQQGYNSGFVRDEAALAVVFVSDKDDCSGANQVQDPEPNPECDGQNLVPVEDYIAFFESLKTNSKLLLVGILGPADPETCESELGQAMPAPRYREVIGAFDGHALASICEPPFAEAGEWSALGRVELNLSYCLRDAATCASDAECDSRCEVSEGDSMGICGSFPVQVEVELESTAPPLKDRVCREVTDAAGDSVIRCLLVDGEDYIVAADPASCSGTTVSVTGYTPGFHDDALLIRYTRRGGGNG